MKKIGFSLIFLCFLVFSNLFSEKYIRSGATGLNDGSNWYNAYSNIPESLERGETYYIADGYYPGPHYFDDIENGSQWILFKKATKLFHGTSSGWNDSYGEDQAILNNIQISRDYYEIDGVEGGGDPNWIDNFGIKIEYISGYTYPLNEKLVALVGPSDFALNQPQNLNFKHIDFKHGGIGLDINGDIIYTYPPNSFSEGVKNVYIGHSYLHDCARNQILTFLSENWTVEYSFFARNFSSSERHSEGWQDFGGQNMTIRNNIWEDITGTSFIALKKNFGYEQSNFMIYGNVFIYTELYDGQLGGQGVVGDTDEVDAVTKDIYIFNNTIYNVFGWNAGFSFTGGTNEDIHAFNNLFVDNPSSIRVDQSSVISDYNFYYHNYTYSSEHSSGLNDKILDSNPLEDPSNFIFNLSEEIGPGISIDQFIVENPLLATFFSDDSYLYDMHNTKRGDGLFWDPGALEYISFSSLDKPFKPSGIKVRN